MNLLNRNLYQSFLSPFSEVPCRLQDTGKDLENFREYTAYQMFKNTNYSKRFSDTD